MMEPPVHKYTGWECEKQRFGDNISVTIKNDVQMGGHFQD